MDETLGDRLGFAREAYERHTVSAAMREWAISHIEKRRPEIAVSAIEHSTALRAQNRVLANHAAAYLSGAVPWRVTLEQQIAAHDGGNSGAQMVSPESVLGTDCNLSLSLRMVAAGWEPVFGTSRVFRHSEMREKRAAYMDARSGHMSFPATVKTAFVANGAENPHAYIGALTDVLSTEHSLRAYWPSGLLPLASMRGGHADGLLAPFHGFGEGDTFFRLLDAIADNVDALTYALMTHAQTRTPYRDRAIIERLCPDLRSPRESDVDSRAALSVYRYRFAHAGFAAPAEEAFAVSERIAFVSECISTAFLAGRALDVADAMNLIHGGFLSDTRLRFHPCVWARILACPSIMIDERIRELGTYLSAQRKIASASKPTQINRRLRIRHFEEDFIEYIATQANIAIEGT